jgi:hypothetical protein
VTVMPPTVLSSLSKQSSPFSLSAAFSLPSSSFLGQSRRLTNFLTLIYARDGGKDKEEEERVTVVPPTVQSSLRNLLFFCGPCLFPLPRSSANLGDYLASSRYSTPAPWP